VLGSVEGVTKPMFNVEDLLDFWEYLNEHSVDDFIDEDGVNVLGYTVNGVFDGIVIVYGGSGDCHLYINDGILSNKVHIKLNNGCNFIGQIPEGPATMLYPTGDRYEGMMKNLLMHGDGRLLYGNCTKIEGTWIEDKIHGYASFEDDSGNVKLCDFDMGELLHTDS